MSFAFKSIISHIIIAFLLHFWSMYVYMEWIIPPSHFWILEYRLNRESCLQYIIRSTKPYFIILWMNLEHSYSHCCSYVKSQSSHFVKFFLCWVLFVLLFCYYPSIFVVCWFIIQIALIVLYFSFMCLLYWGVSFQVF
jgi:hypothetical protein